MPRVSAIVVSFNSRAYLERSLGSVLGAVDDVVVVDSASSDGSGELVRERFPSVRIIELQENRGFGAAMNVGVEATDGDYLLLLNPDAWATDGAVATLVECAEGDVLAGIVGPRLSNPDGTLQRSVRGYPTPWRLATEYFFLRWLAPRSRLFNSFYGAGFDHGSTANVEFLVGAALLVRRSAFDEIGGFDPDFFMFNEEVDLSYRMKHAGRRILFCPEAEFAHVGGASTTPVWDSMYREQLRSHLRFLNKHHDQVVAERMRKVLVWAMRLRALVFRGERRRLSRATARWLASAPASVLIAEVRSTSTGGPPGADDQCAPRPPRQAVPLEPDGAEKREGDERAQGGAPGGHALP
jgi:N-acetylglucosaminyl-diphospho-decaprenol L-rhamnosyltransferase